MLPRRTWRHAIFDLDDFVDGCRSALVETQPMLAVKEIVERGVADPSAIAAGLPQRPGVTIVARSADLTVISVIVPGGLPMSRAVPHDHRMWAVVGIYAGQEDNRFFRRAENSVVESGGRSLRLSDCLAMGDDTIHAVHNPLDHSALAAVHVYGGDLIGVPRRMWTGAAYEEQPYDDKKVVGGGGFKSAPS